jgi:Flp pilus assembly protein protease CpaA
MLDLLSAPASLPGAEIRIFLALAFTAAAAYFDVFNKKWVPNYLVYAFAVAALLVNVVFFTPQLFTQALAFGGIIFVLTYFLYRTGQLGGADVYVLASVAAMLPYLPKPLLAPAQAVPYPFILSVLAPTGLAFILHMVARFVPYVSRRISGGSVTFSAQKLIGPALLAVAFAFFIYELASLPFALPPAYMAILSFLFAALLFFSLFKQEIKDSMVGMVPVGRLEEEDVLALDKMDPGLVKRLSLKPLMDAKVISALRKSGLKKVPVYTGMPFFLPYLFFGLLFSVLFGDMLFYFVAGAF